LTLMPYNDRIRIPEKQEGGTMSLGIAFKGPEGIVLAADSRVTLMAQMPQQPNQPSMLLPSTYDNATKLLAVRGHPYVGAVTFGLGALGQTEPRTAHSFIPEFEDELQAASPTPPPIPGVHQRFTVEDFAKRLSAFFMKQWGQLMPAQYTGENMIFFVAGYDSNAVYGRVFEFSIPSKPVPVEQNVGTFGILFGGQKEFVERILHGFDGSLSTTVQKFLNLSAQQTANLTNHLHTQFNAKIPMQFLPLQDCVDLSIFLIRITITIQTWLVGVRGVGGAIDVATVTRIAGFQPIQQKKITGDKPAIHFEQLGL
jgi:hypothetical protein